MSYAMAAALQEAVFGALASDPTLVGFVGADIYDALPPGPLPSIYVMLGAENVRDRSDRTGAGALHELTISVVTDSAGFQSAKQAGAAICDVLDEPALVLSRGRLVGLSFLKAAARREGTGNIRRIDLRFRARVEDD